MSLVNGVAFSGWTALPCCCLLLGVLACGCGTDSREPSPRANQREPTSKEGTMRAMQLTSSGLQQGATIDRVHTADGDDRSPPLAWSGAPEGTQSFALICEDPDAPSPKRPAKQPWVHWVIFNLGADRRELPEGIDRSPHPSRAPEATQGVNAWPSDNVGYRGPAPPPGSGRHRYFFTIYALDTVLDLQSGAGKQQLIDAMSGHILAQGQLMGTYER